MATEGEKPQEAESQLPQTPGQHEKAIEERIMNLLDPKPAEEKPEVKAEDAPAEEKPAEEAPAETEAKAEEKPKEDALPEAVEVEYEGAQYKVPPPLKDALLRQSDYTKKTQELAESRKNAELVMQQVNSLHELQKAAQKQYGQLAAIEEQIAQYEKVDWNTLTAQDATRAQQLFIAFQQAKDAKGKLEKEVQQAQSQQSEAAQKIRSAKLEEGNKILTRDLKGWGPEMGRKIMGFAQETYGYSPEELSSVVDPRQVKILADAYAYRQLQAAKPAEKKIPAVASVALKPKAAEAKSPASQAYDADRNALRSASRKGDSSAMMKSAEKLILRKLG